MRFMQLRLSVFCCVVAASAFASEVYRNDFSARTSKKPIMTGRWHELAYETDNKPLYYQYEDSQLAGNAALPYIAPWEFQDAWFKFYSTSTGERPSLNVRKGSAAGSTNPYLAVVSNGTVNVATPIYNDFTSGVVRISCDIRAYDGLAKASSYVRIRPVYKAHLVPGADNTKVYASAFGVQLQGDTVEAIMLHGDGNGGSQGLDELTGIEKGHWYRYEVELDLDKLRETGCVYDLGTGHPDITTVGSELGRFPTNRKFNYNPSDEYGPISGVLLSLSGVKSDGDSGFDASISPAVDNLVVSWKAPGASLYEPVYENNFATRRYRTLSPAGTTASRYAMSTGSYTDEYSYACHTQRLDKISNMSRLLPALDESLALQAVGYDGWRRIGSGGQAHFAVVDWSKNVSNQPISGENGSAVLRVTGNVSYGSKNFGYATVQLGDRITSGKVCLRADVRIPREWTESSYLTRYEAAIMLGDTSVYEASSISGHYALRGGITGNPSSGEKSATRFQPYNSAVDGYDSYDDYPLAPTNWYRIALTADLDNRTSGSSLKIWKIGAQSQKSSFEPSPESLVFERDGLPLKSADISEIGSIILYAAAPDAANGNSDDRHNFICYDNIVVTKNVGAANETVIYRNAFSTRTRTFDNVTAGGLVGTLNNDDGADHWIRRMSGTGSCRIFGEDDPHVAAWADGDSGSYAVHPLGKAVKVGTIRADIRPPKCWATKNAASSSNSRIASVSLGGDAFLQGCHKDSTSFASVYGAITFGFTDTTAKKDQTGVCTNVQAYVYGNGREFLTLNKKLNTSHWYRFVADFNSTERAWSVKVYDMGTEHPAADAALGELVAEKDGLQFRNPADGGISGLCFNTQSNAPVLANDPDDAGMALYDNVVLQEEDRGVAVIIR